jgi:hypothetical protein
MAPELLDRVFSVLPGRKSYSAYSVTDVEEHISDLSARICACPKKCSELVLAYRADQDALLERRAYLQMLSPRME